MNEWIEKYKTKMDGRYITYKIAFDLLLQIPTHNIVETGCVRMKDDWGAGYSTMLFGEFCSLFGGKITSVDISDKHLNISKELTTEYNKFITYTESDSIDFLSKYNEMIDLLYLDSMDVPLGIDADHSVCQRHNLHEFMAAEKKLHDKSIVLIDDFFGGDGKGKLTENYMIQNGWRRIMAYQQQLFVK